MPPKAARPPKKGSKKDLENKAAKVKASEDVPEDLSSEVKGLSLDEFILPETNDGGRVATGILVSEPRARNIKIAAFSLSLHGHVLVEDTAIELNQGSRYGLVGRNGCGKSVSIVIITHSLSLLLTHYFLLYFYRLDIFKMFSSS
jgi:ATP-binding cassette subfamily F protein 2